MSCSDLTSNCSRAKVSCEGEEDGGVNRRLSAKAIIGAVLIILVLGYVTARAEKTFTFGFTALGISGQVELPGSWISERSSLLVSAAWTGWTGLGGGLRVYIFKGKPIDSIELKPFNQGQLLFLAVESQEYSGIMVAALYELGLKLVIKEGWVIEGCAGVGVLSMGDRQARTISWRIGAGWIF
jgi:hypothetical protein